MAIFPSAVATDSDLYIAKNGLATILSSSIDNIVTTVPVTSTTGFPAVGYIVIDSEVIKYTSIDATNFLGCTRASDGTSASSHSSGASVKANAVADHHNALKDEIKAIEQNISDRLGFSSTQNILPLGSQLVPSLTFAGDLNTGLYAGGADDLYITIGGVGRYTFLAGQMRLPVGNVSVPSLSFGTDNDSGFYWFADGSLVYAGNGVDGVTLTYANIQLVDGTANLPAYTFRSDSNTGLYHSGADTLDFTTAGVRRITIDSAGNFIMRGGEIDLSDGTVSNPSLNFLSDANTGLYSIGSDNMGVSVGGLKVAGFKQSGVAIIGTNAADNAPAGWVGEYVESLSTSDVNAAANNVWDDLTSITLSAGDWDVQGFVQFDRNGSTWTGAWVGITTVSGNNAPASVQLRVPNEWVSSSSTPTYVTGVMPPTRFSLSASTTVYLKRQLAYSAGTPRSRSGVISARRVR